MTKEDKKTKQRKTFPGRIVIAQTADPRAHWYVVHTYSAHEIKVCHNLQQRIETMDLADRILEILIPTQQDRKSVV